MEEEQQRIVKLEYLCTKFGYCVFKPNTVLGTKIFDTDSALRLYEMCICNLYETIEKLNARIERLEIIK